MQVFNVEIFDRNFNFIHNYTVENIVYKFDYLTPVENEVTISNNSALAIGQYIVLTSVDTRFEGVISSLQIINENYIRVGYYPLNSLFNMDIFIDNRLQQGGENQGTKSIESIIYDNLNNLFINGYSIAVPYYWTSGQDDLQKIPGLTLTKTTDTMLWMIGLTDAEYGGAFGGNNVQLNIYNDLIPAALKGCSVGVITRLDVEAKKVYCTIGVLNSTTQKIEADLPQILTKNIVENDTSLMCNKYVFCWPSETGLAPTVYYRHSDGTWNTTNTDRITPVITTIETAYSDMYEGDSIPVRLFKKYGALKYVNLIELTTINNVYDLEFGDIAQIICGNSQYESMLTGYEINANTIKYIFGMIRLDLTKILKRRL